MLMAVVVLTDHTYIHAHSPILFLDCGDRVGVLCRIRVPDDEDENESCDVRAWFGFVCYGGG